MITPESRAKTQVCIVADFIRTQGDLSLLRNLWSRISSFTDHQASLCNFDWGEEHLTVSFIPVLQYSALPVSAFYSEVCSFSGNLSTHFHLCHGRHSGPSDCRTVLWHRVRGQWPESVLDGSLLETTKSVSRAYLPEWTSSLWDQW